LNGNLAKNDSGIELEQIEAGQTSVSGNAAHTAGMDELLCRPSWCDAKFALKQVKKVSPNLSKFII